MLGNIILEHLAKVQCTISEEKCYAIEYWNYPNISDSVRIIHQKTGKMHEMSQTDGFIVLEFRN
jgi:hypothetical protein